MMSKWCAKRNKGGREQGKGAGTLEVAGDGGLRRRQWRTDELDPEQPGGSWRGIFGVEEGGGVGA